MMKEKSVHVQYRYNFFLNVFNLQLVESTDMEPEDMQVQLYLIPSKQDPWLST